MAQADTTDKADANQNDASTKKKMDAAQIANLKQLRIQSGALNRYTKELKSYMKELSELKAQLTQLRNENEHNDDEKQNSAKKVEIKQQHQAIEETENVIRDIRPKLVKTWETVDQLIKDLDGYLVEDEDDIQLFQNTKVFLENAEPLVND
mmetsp:Transcript_12363/g.19693  ORF Transcript_12363/g.19693 Transcript_12363/m.19693 type:complete len:151 (-) Transcript_12363:282-734(-)